MLTRQRQGKPANALKIVARSKCCELTRQTMVVKSKRSWAVYEEFSCTCFTWRVLERGDVPHARILRRFELAVGKAERQEATASENRAGAAEAMGGQGPRRVRVHY